MSCICKYFYIRTDVDWKYVADFWNDIFCMFCSVGVALSRGHGKYFFKGNVSLEAGEDLRSLHTEAKHFGCGFFSRIRRPFPSKCLLRMQKRIKSNLIQFFYDRQSLRGRQCKRDWHNMRSIFFFRAKISDSVCNDLYFISKTYQSDFILWCKCLNMWPWTTKPVLGRWGIFVAITKNTFYGSKW